MRALSTDWGQTLSLWDLASGKQALELKQAEAGGEGAFFPNGSRIIWGAGSWVTVWDLTSGKLVRSLGAPSRTAVVPFARSSAVSPDGKAVMAGRDDGTIRIWDGETGQLLRTLLGDPSPFSVVYSADGAHVVSGSGDRTVKLWDVASGRIVRTFRGHEGIVWSVALSPDGAGIASGSEDATVKLWDVTTGSLLRTLIGHGADVKSVAYSPNGRLVVSGSEDTTLKIWDTNSGALLVTAIATRDGEWLVITPEGFFAASEKGNDLLSVVRGLNVWSVKQFYQSLYRPDLVREKLAGDPRGLVREAAANLDLDKVIASGDAPDVRLMLPGRGLSAADQGRVLAEAEVRDRGGGIGRIEWRVNGVTSGIDNPASPPSGQPARLTRSLALDEGNNEVSVVAYNRANLIASVASRVAVASSRPAAVPGPGPGVTTTPAPPLTPAGKARLFVLAAGVNLYADDRLHLEFAVSDAKEVARAFSAAGGNLYQSVDVKLLTDAEVTRDRIDAAFKEIAAKAQAADVFVLYLAGHGKTVDGRYYFVPQPFVVTGELQQKFVDPAVRALGISQDQLQLWMASVPAHRSLILLDTCESGTVAGDAGETQQLERGAANDRLAQATGRSIITAAAGSEEANEGYHQHGLFTYEMLDGFNRADSDGNGKIEVAELAAYLYAEVSALSPKLYHRRQSPQVKLASDYPLAARTRVLQDDAASVVEVRPTFQLKQTANLQVRPGHGQAVVRRLTGDTPVAVLENQGAWSLIATGGRPLGYVATRDLVPLR